MTAVPEHTEAAKHAYDLYWRAVNLRSDNDLKTITVLLGFAAAAGFLYKPQNENGLSGSVIEYIEIFLAVGGLAVSLYWHFRRNAFLRTEDYWLSVWGTLAGASGVDPAGKTPLNKAVERFGALIPAAGFTILVVWSIVCGDLPSCGNRLPTCVAAKLTQ